MQPVVQLENWSGPCRIFETSWREFSRLPMKEIIRHDTKSKLGKTTMGHPEHKGARLLKDMVQIFRSHAAPVGGLDWDPIYSKSALAVFLAPASDLMSKECWLPGEIDIKPFKCVRYHLLITRSAFDKGQMLDEGGPCLPFSHENQ